MDEKQKAYQEKAEAKLKEWSARIDELKAKAQSAEAQAKVDYYNKLEDVRVKENAARQKLDELKSAGSEAWEKLKGGVEGAMGELEKAVSKS